jgi:hypothetical protein
VNQTRPLLTTGGKQAILGVQVLKKCLVELQNLENIDPNRWLIPNRRMKTARSGRGELLVRTVRSGEHQECQGLLIQCCGTDAF